MTPTLHRCGYTIQGTFGIDFIAEGCQPEYVQEPLSDVGHLFGRH